MSTPPDPAHAIRGDVSRDYAEAIRNTTESCCGERRDAKGAVAGAAGYDEAELASLPATVPGSSFGCGNPLAFGEIREGDVVLDLGSGGGLDLLLAARKVGPTGRVLGVDMTDAMVDRAMAVAREAGLDNVEVRKGLIEDLPIEGASVDWVISNCVINLSPEKAKVFAEIARVLKPGGRMVVSDIVAESLSDEVRANPTLVSCCLGGAIPEAAYVDGLRRAGLVDVEILDRIRYDAAQLEALAGGGATEASRCCATPTAVDAPNLARGLAGTVWSAMFSARRPA